MSLVPFLQFICKMYQTEFNLGGIKYVWLCTSVACKCAGDEVDSHFLYVPQKKIVNTALRVENGIFE